MPQGSSESPATRQRREELIRRLRGLLEPPMDSMGSIDLGKDEEGNQMKSELPMPAHPYPFFNPVTMTPDIDASVKKLRGLAPGAGTARNSVMDSELYIPAAMNTEDKVVHPVAKQAMMRGMMDPRNTKLWGLSDTYEGDNAPEDFDRVYIAPKDRIAKTVGAEQAPYEFDKTVAHELAHRNLPSTPEGLGEYGEPPGTDFFDRWYDEIHSLQPLQPIVKSQRRQLSGLGPLRRMREDY